MAVTYDGAHVLFYVNGVLTHSEPAIDVISTDGSLRIGGVDLWWSDEGFQGRIDEVRIYNRPLSEAEIHADRATPIRTPLQGAVAAYTFDKGEGTTVEDVTGAGNTAMIEDAEWTTHGHFGGAMEFTAAEHSVLKVPDSPALDFAEEFTLEAWVRPSGGTNTWAPIVDKQYGNAEGESRFAYWLYVGQWEEKPFGGTEDASSEEGTVTSSEPLPKKAWSHVALTYDGKNVRLYVNGQLVGTDTVPAPQITEGELQIGGSAEHGDYFDGRIDEVHIYNRALSASELGS